MAENKRNKREEGLFLVTHIAHKGWVGGGCMCGILFYFSLWV